MAEVEIRAVSKAFKKAQAVSDLSLTVGDGEFVALLGPTGAGKTTTLRLIAGLEMPDRGSIRIDGRDVTGDAPADRDVAFVFQQYSLYPHLTVFENMAFALRAPIRRVPEAEIRAKVRGSCASSPHRNQAGQQGNAIVGRADAARRDRPGPGALTLDLSHGRAALLAGRQAARRNAPRTQAHPDRSRRDDPLCHPRSDRSDDHGFAHRRDRGRAADADRYAARDLREPGQRSCRRAAWSAGDQPPAGGLSLRARRGVPRPLARAPST